MAPPAPTTIVNRQDFCAPILKELSESAEAYGLFRCSAALADCQAVPIDENLTEFTLSSDETQSRQCVTAVLSDKISPKLPTLNTRIKQLHNLWQQVSAPYPSDEEQGMLGEYLDMRILRWVDDDTDAYFTTSHGQDPDHLWQLRNSLRSLQARWKPAPPRNLKEIVAALYDRVASRETTRGNILVPAADFYEARTQEIVKHNEGKPEASGTVFPAPTESRVRLLDCHVSPLDDSLEVLRYNGQIDALVRCWQDWTLTVPSSTQMGELLSALQADGKQLGEELTVAQWGVMAWRLRAYIFGNLSPKEIPQTITDVNQAISLATHLEALAQQEWTAQDHDIDPDDREATTLRGQLSEYSQALRAHGETLAATEDLRSGWAALHPDGLRFRASIGRSETSHTFAVRDPYAGFDVDYTADPAMAFELEMLWNLRPWLSLGVGAKFDWKHFVAEDNFHTVSVGPSIAAYFTVWEIPWHEMALVLAPVLGATFGTLVTPEAVNVGHPALLYRTKNLRPFYNVTLGGQVLVNIPVSDHFNIDVGLSASAQYLEYADGPLQLRNPWAAVLAFTAAASYYF